MLQVDEPGLPRVLSGQVPTPSGYGTVRSLPRSVATPALAALLEVAPPGHRVVHCCAADVPYDTCSPIPAPPRCLSMPA